LITYKTTISSKIYGVVDIAETATGLVKTTITTGKRSIKMHLLYKEEFRKMEPQSSVIDWRKVDWSKYIDEEEIYACENDPALRDHCKPEDIVFINFWNRVMRKSL